jgi:hypothetical protein
MTTYQLIKIYLNIYGYEFCTISLDYVTYLNNQ